MTKQVFDREGNVTTSTNAKNLNTTFVFDSMNRVTRVTAPVVGATNWTYTTMGYVASRTDALSTATVPRVATWTYDLAGRNTERRDAAGRRFTFGYDIAGNQTSIVDANANTASDPGLGTTTMMFDQLNRLTTKSYSDGTAPVSWTFDTQGRVASMTDGAGTATYVYDAADRVNQITRGTDIWSYSYDAVGNVVSRTVPGGADSTSTFDDAGQLVGLTDTAGTTNFAYDPVGNGTTIGFPNGVTQTRTFDRASRLASIATAGPGGPIGGYSYTRDANGNPTGIDVSGPAGVIVAESMRNTYDNADRLTKTCFTTTTCTTANQTTWSYNQVGSRLTEKIGTGAVSTYTYDIADQLTAITGPGAASFTYNPNGDQLTAGTDTFTYNTARQTVSATVAGVTTQYAYDGNGNRHTVTTAGVATQEVWDTNGGLPTLVAQRDSTGVVQRRYTYAGPTPIKYEDVTGANTGYYHTDAMGSITNLTTPTGTVGATYRYNPYGTTRTATSVLPGYAANPLKYTGQQQDPTSNYNLRARHYNPGRGTFTQTDPWTRPAGSTAEAGYAYTGDNPMGYVDPSGMCRRSTLRRLNPIIRFDSTPSTTVAGSQTDCPSLFARMRDFAFGVKGVNSNIKGLETRWFEMFRDGVLNGKTKFDGHQHQFNGQQKGLRDRLKDWFDDCDDKSPPSSIQVLQLEQFMELATMPTPTWKDVNDALALSKASYSQVHGNPGPRPSHAPISVPWRTIGIVAAVTVAVVVVVLLAPEIAAAGAGAAGMAAMAG